MHTCMMSDYYYVMRVLIIIRANYNTSYNSFQYKMYTHAWHVHVHIPECRPRQP